MKKIVFKTKKKREVVDISESVNTLLGKQEVKSGLCHLFALHTTASLATADLDPGTDLDMLEAYDAMVPDLNYRHPHDPSHVSDHILGTLLRTHLLVPFENKKLMLGQWQKIVLFEFDGPRERNIVVTILKTE